jgi:hypothetical protein
LATREGAADVAVCVGSVDLPPSLEVRAEGLHFHATVEEVFLFWEDAGSFLVRGGREIIVDPLPGVDERILRLCILGPALGVLLHQRRQLVLHASAVAVDGGAVAFLGEAGWGKSTMAAAMYARGHGIVADDVTAVRANKANPIVHPGFPQLKLWPEAATAVGNALETLPRIQPSLEKRARRSDHEFSPDPLPLRCIYVLGESETQEIAPLRSQEALVELIRHSYTKSLLRVLGASSHFLQCSSIVKNVTIRSFKRPRSLPSLSDMAQLVEKDLAEALE